MIGTPTKEIIHVTLEIEIDYDVKGGRDYAIRAITNRYPARDGGSGGGDKGCYGYTVLSVKVNEA
jgi:hypothetical protein